MTTKDKIIAELSGLDEAGLSEVHAVVRRLSERRPKEVQEVAGQSLMDRLREIRIVAPPDFSENHELYASGAKQIEDVR